MTVFSADAPRERDEMKERQNRQKVVVIAEIGVNHNGSLELAKELVTQCAGAGADYAKFQTFTAGNLAADGAPLADYQKKDPLRRNQKELLSSLELTRSDFENLVAHCAAEGIGFLTTAHDLESTSFVFGLGLDFIKVPSGDVTNYPLLTQVAQQRTPVLLSTGASTAEEVGSAVHLLELGGVERANITVMQCTTEYPAPPEEANLLAMVEMGGTLGVPVGFSDHTAGIDASLAAVALGAQVLEKHITMDRNLTGPDHAASLEPDQFGSMVRQIRHVETLLGTRQKVVTPSEFRNRNVIRKSIVAATRIESGDLLGPHNLGLLRPGTGLSPMRWPELIGTRASRCYLPGERLELP